MVLSGKVVQERLNLHRPHIPGVTLAMKQHELSDPIAIGALRTAAEMPTAADNGKLIE